MRFLHSLLAVGTVAFSLHASAAVAVAQSTVTSTVSGSVTDPSGARLNRALVSLVPIAGGADRQVSVGADGRFVLARVAPGTYEVRVEAVGYRPVVARTLSMGAGEIRALSFVLTPAAPPVVSVDSIALSGGSNLDLTGSGARVDARGTADLPRRYGDLSWLAALTSTFDASLGTQGLPGDLTAVVVDGVPVYRAPHPHARSELVAAPPFPASFLSTVSVLGAPTDVEWSGGGGGHVIASTRVAGGETAFGAEAAYSGDVGWSSSELDVEAPALHSFEGGFDGSVGSGEGARLFLAGDVLRHQSPLVPRTSEALVGQLPVLAPDVASAHTTPAVESFGRYAGLARIDARAGENATLFVRAAGSYEQRSFDGVGPVSLAREAAPDEQSVDLSVVGGTLGQYSPRVLLELRAGFSGSFRDFGAASYVPTAHIAADGAVLGATPAGAGTSSRSDFVLIPVLHFTPAAGRFKVGASVRASTHTMDHTPWAGGEYAFTDAAAVEAAVGYAQLSTAGEVSFATQEYGLFAQYSTTPSPGLHISLGGRWDYERIPVGDVVVDEEWRSATGLSNADAPSSFPQFGVRGALTWDPPAAPGLRVSAAASVDYGDVDTRAVYELLSQETGPTVSRSAGAGVAWPAEGLPGAAALPTLTLFGPDTRPPRSTAYGLGISQRLLAGLSAHVRGTLRRTDFLLRRRNLNVAPTARALDENGRSVYGTLDKVGALVSATGDDARRFPEFGDVWALDPDGWSEHTGVTVGFDYAAASVALFGAYTWSRTRDNWVGAATGLVDASLPPMLPDAAGGAGWAESTSDFDVPHRAAGGATLRFGAAALSGTYRYRSGLPFTPGYRFGVDANGDGSVRNDVAFVPGDAQLMVLLDDWPCLEDHANAFAARNSCRGASRHAVDVGLEIALGNVGGRAATLRLDALNLVDEAGGVVDRALLLVDPDDPIATSGGGSTVAIPTAVNPDFGTVLYPSSRGRMLRLGLRVGR